jgi:hypothetical protein
VEEINILKNIFFIFRVSPSELNKPVSKREYITQTITYNEKTFRQSSVPILWIDEQGDVRWNEAAERGMITYITQKQFPHLDKINNTPMNKARILKICRPQSLFVLHQHWSGFFSRVLCFIAQFGQSLHSPRIAILRGNRFSGGRGETDDFLGQGIIRYFLPMSICSAYQYHPDMTELKNLVDQAPKAVTILRTQDLYDHATSDIDHVFLSTEFWKLDYHHVPIRKWLFDRKETTISYDSSVSVLTDHTDEHIYAPNNNENYTIGEWIDRNKPDAFSSDLLPNKGNYNLTWQDYAFGSFLRYMFVLYFGSQNAPRIEYGVQLLADYWKSYLTDKYTIPRNINVFDSLAGLYIRRGDKWNEDSFWATHKHWRNLSLYVKGVIDEEQQRKTTFKYIYVMTDDSSVMKSFQDFVDPKSENKDEAYAREHLRGKEILYNVMAPQACFDPFHRVGFEQFLVSMRFLIDHAAIAVGHTDSNVFRFFREVVYAQRQHRPNVQTFTYVKNAPNSFDNKMEAGTTAKTP